MIQKILHGNDTSDNAFKALEAAIELAHVTGAELHSICVEELPRYAGTVGEVVEEQATMNWKYNSALDKAVSLAAAQGVKLQTHIIVGHGVKTIIEFINQNDFDLLVVGFMGHSALYERVMGGTCQNLVRLAKCSVYVVK